MNRPKSRPGTEVFHGLNFALSGGEIGRGSARTVPERRASAFVEIAREAGGDRLAGVRLVVGIAGRRIDLEAGGLVVRAKGKSIPANASPRLAASATHRSARSSLSVVARSVALPPDRRA